MSESPIDMINRIHRENTDRLYKRLEEEHMETWKYRSLYHFLIGWTLSKCGEGMTAKEYAAFIEEKMFGKEDH